MFIKMETINGYKTSFEKKKDHLYARMDESMITRLREIRRKTGISVSEIIREAVRRLLQEIETDGSINLKI
jgi:predicted DNA-binding protein